MALRNTTRIRECLISSLEFRFETFDVFNRAFDGAQLVDGRNNECSLTRRAGRSQDLISEIQPLDARAL